MTYPSSIDDDLAIEVWNEHLQTGRKIREILESMRDEGYISCSEDEFEEYVLRAGNGETHSQTELKS